MITTLAIKNYALIDDIQVDLQSGLTIITGETGAGKSILLGALALLLGKRADLTSARDPHQKCVIEGEFSVAPYGLKSLFEQNNLDYEDHTILRREILPSGKSRAFVNDTPVTLQQMQALGPHLVDIHSQHETLALSNEAYQLDVIDALAGNLPLLKTYIQELSNYNATKAELDLLQGQKETALKELDYHSFLYSELKEANLDNVDQLALEESYEKLSNAEEIQATLAKVTQLFSDDAVGTLETAKEARNALGTIKHFSSDFESLWERLHSCIIELEDLYETIESGGMSVEADPSSLVQINETLQTLYKLQQKHSAATVEELLVIQQNLEQKVSATLDLDEAIAHLETVLQQAKIATTDIATQLRSKREQAIPKLKEALELLLAELGLPHAQFQFQMTSSEHFRSSGMDHLELLFTANKGMTLGPLRKVASGGEMSRIMLTVKAVLIRYKKLPTIIFDEIDTGVSGEIATKMAHIMDEMSSKIQLLSITHLPQIAAKGMHHIKVYKEEINDRTATRLQSLNREERVVEIAQMIGGHQVTDSALAHANELLN